MRAHRAPAVCIGLLAGGLACAADCLPDVSVQLMVRIGDAPPVAAALEGGIETPLSLFEVGSRRLLWSAAAHATAIQEFPGMTAAFTGSIAAIDLDGDGLHDRVVVEQEVGWLPVLIDVMVLPRSWWTGHDCDGWPHAVAQPTSALPGRFCLVARKAGGLQVIPAQPQFRVIHNRQDVIDLPGESLYRLTSQAALANFAVRVRRQFGCPEPLPG